MLITQIRQWDALLQVHGSPVNFVTLLYNTIIVLARKTKKQ